MKHRLQKSALVLAASLWLGDRARGVQFGQIDDFQDGTAMGWSHGGQSLAPPSNVPTGGPAGAGDAYLQNLSSGTSGADSKQIMFNQAQWTGDYLDAHVTRLQASMANFGATTLYMRVIMEGFTGSYFSTNPAVLAPGSGWQNVTFDLTSAGMTNLAGDSTPDSSVLSGIFEVRILSSQAGFSRTGDTQNASLGMDNLRRTHASRRCGF